MIFEQYDNIISPTTMQKIKDIIKKTKTNKLNKSEICYLLENINYESFPLLQQEAYQRTREVYQDSVFIRGLIEISNYCIQDCLYCGIRKSNRKVERYRYDKDIILETINNAYLKGYRTIVLQAGEDPYFNDNLLSDIVKTIKELYPDLALTLSLGVKDKESYQQLFDSGANRYLLRHESASNRLFSFLHTSDLTMENRLNALHNLKEIGYQTGAGFMVGSPSQTTLDLVEDFIFIQDLQPHMIGIGPFLVSKDTPFYNYTNPRVEAVLICYSLARLLVSNALLPSTTAMASLDKEGRLKALKSGCNVIMINLSLKDNRIKYSLYENKTYKGDESDEFIQLIESDINKAHLKMDYSIGNFQKRKADKYE